MQNQKEAQAKNPDLNKIDFSKLPFKSFYVSATYTTFVTARNKEEALELFDKAMEQKMTAEEIICEEDD